VDIVNTSNWSKFSPEGEPYFDQNGKILKGPNYKAPDLSECV
jgi:predicted HAD superfamily Cof-like phosphohydrolase